MNYKVRFVDYPRHYHLLKSEIDAAIKDTLEGGDFILRRHLKEFENKMAAFVSTGDAIGLNSGTDAIHLSLIAAGVGSGDEVITVAHTFVATVASIIHCGATPVLVDVSRDFNMDMAQVEKAISKKTKAIIPVHLNGRPCDMEKLMAIADKRGLHVIEDAAQALGATFDGKRVGSFGLTGCFSFYPAKILGGFGDGGMLVTSDPEIARKVRLLRDHGQDRATGEIHCYGFNSRLDNMQAAILDAKLKHLPEWIARRREIASIYGKGLAGLAQVKTPPPPGEGRYFDVFTNYVIRAQDRDKLVAYLTDTAGIEVLVSWPKPMHQQKALGLSRFHLPETEKISREVVSLPNYPEISNDHIEFVIESIRKFYNVASKI